MTYPTRVEDSRDVVRQLDNWLSETQHGYGDLHTTTKALLAFFIPVWSVFEAKAVNFNAHRGTIEQFVFENVPDNADIQKLQPALDFFTSRYVEGTRTNKDFEELIGIREDLSTSIGPVLLGNVSGSQQRVICLLLIVYCLRNNMAHGVKWMWGFEDQHEVFAHAVFVLMITLDEFGGQEEGSKANG